jgi:hypothetical protein
MRRTGDEHGKGKQPRTVTATRPAGKWILQELVDVFGPRRAFWELEQQRAHLEHDWDAEQAAMLNLLRYGLGLTRSGVLSKHWQDRANAGEEPPEMVSAMMALVFAWRVAQCLFSGNKPASARVEELDRVCAGYQERRNLSWERDEQLAARLRQLAGTNHPELLRLAEELPFRPLADDFALWWHAAHWVLGLVRGPAGYRRYVCQRFHLCQECGSIILLRKGGERERRFCDRYCRRRHARKKVDP